MRFALFIFLFCVIFPNYVSGNKDKSFNESVSQYELEYHWKLASVGKTAKQFLRIFFWYEPTYAALKSGLNSGHSSKKIVGAVIAYSFLQQVLMTILVCVGFLCVLLLILSPFFISMYRKYQDKIASEEEDFVRCFVKPEQGWLVYELLCVSLAVTVFGGILMYLSVIELDGKFSDLFDLGVFVVETSYDLKQSMLDQFYNGLRDISHNAFEVIRLMYDVNDDIGDRFMQSVRNQFKPVNYLAKSLQWDIAGILNVLKFDKSRFEKYVNTTNGDIVKLTEQYRVTLTNLNNTISSEGNPQNLASLIEPLFEFPKFTSPNVTFEDFDKSIKRLEQISALDFQAKLQNVSQYLHTSIIYPNYDPTDVMEKLRKIAFDTEEAIRFTVSRFFHFVDGQLKEEDRDRLLKTIKDAQSDVEENVVYLRLIFLIFSIVSAVLGILYFLVYTAGVIGTRGFRSRPSGVTVHKNSTSHGSGKTLVVWVYFTVIFLAFFWAISVVIFFLSAVPFEVCLGSRDLSLFQAVIDDRARLSGDWYSMYSSKQFNNTIKDTFYNCQKNPSYFNLLPDPLVNRSDFENVKNQLDSSKAAEAVKKIVQNLPNASITDNEDSTLDLESILDINVHPYFSSVSEFLKAITEKNASKVLEQISKRKGNSDKLNTEVHIVIKSYETLIDTLSNTVAEELTFNDSLAAANASASMAEVQLESFKITMEILIDFIEENTTSIYISALNESMSDMVDAVYFNMDLTTTEFRQSISMCHILNVTYLKISLLACERFLYPWSAAWLGSFFVDIFLLLSVLLILYSIPLFIITPKVTSLPLPTTVRFEDIPNEVLLEGSLRNILLREPETYDGDEEAQAPQDMVMNADESTSTTDESTSTTDDVFAQDPQESESTEQDPSKETLTAASVDDGSIAKGSTDNLEEVSKKSEEDIKPSTFATDSEGEKEVSLEDILKESQKTGS